MHATIVSILSSMAFLSDPNLFEDLVYHSNSYAKVGVALASGYFLGDAVILLMEWKLCKNISRHDEHLNTNVLLHHLTSFAGLYFTI